MKLVFIFIGIIILFSGCSRKLDLNEFHRITAPIAQITPPPTAMEHRSQRVVVVVEPVGDWKERRNVKKDLERILSAKPFIISDIIEGKLNQVIGKVSNFFPLPKYLIVIHHIFSQTQVKCNGFGCPQRVTSLSQFPLYIQTENNIPPEIEIIIKGEIDGELYSLPEMKKIIPLYGKCKMIKIFPYSRNYNQEVNYKIMHPQSKKKIFFYRRPVLPIFSSSECLSSAVYNFSRKVWRKLAPLGYVMEIRRNSDGDFVAKVNLGENNGIWTGQKVIFYHLTKTKEPFRQKEIIEWHKIGEGEISNQFGPNFSWVWIDDYIRLPEIGDVVIPLF